MLEFTNNGSFSILCPFMRHMCASKSKQKIRYHQYVYHYNQYSCNYAYYYQNCEYVEDVGPGEPGGHGSDAGQVDGVCLDQAAQEAVLRPLCPLCPLPSHRHV